jgi:hypothetical protein
MESLHAWLHNNPPPNPATTYPAAYRRLVCEQNTLGWRQLFNTCWSTEWSRLHEQFILRSFDPIPSKMSGTNWTSTYITLIWTSFRLLWDGRNGKVHGIDTSSRSQARLEKVHRELRALYTLHPVMRFRDHDVFHKSADHHIDKSPVWAIQNWLRIKVPMAKHSVKEAVRLAVQNVRTITSYFRGHSDAPPSNMIEHSPSGPGRESTLPAGG